MEKNKAIVNMINIMVNFKTVLIYLALILVICAATNCTPHKSSSGNSESTDINVNDTCSACTLDSFHVKQSLTFEGEKMLIDKSTAIQFFNRAWLVDKYDNQKSRDTLVKLLNMKNLSDRGVIYALTDQYFYFREVMRPMLISNAIQVIDTLPDNRLIELKGIHGSFFVNTSTYKDQDGVLLFIPEKEPVFWTMNGERIHCKNSQGLASQYFFCP